MSGIFRDLYCTYTAVQKFGIGEIFKVNSNRTVIHLCNRLIKYSNRLILHLNISDSNSILTLASNKTLNTKY